LDFSNSLSRTLALARVLACAERPLHLLRIRVKQLE
jgi:hypothetical protein